MRLRGAIAECGAHGLQMTDDVVNRGRVLIQITVRAPQEALVQRVLRERALKTYRRFEPLAAREPGGRAIVDLRARTLLAKAMVESGGPEFWLKSCLAMSGVSQMMSLFETVPAAGSMPPVIAPNL